MPLRSLKWQTWVGPPAAARRRASDPPLRAELFGVEQLSRLARGLAADHQIVQRHSSTGLLARLARNEATLRAFNHNTVAVERTRQLTPAAEWILDNFYLIEEQIQTARRHLPRNYSHELPRILGHSAPELPRVYTLVLELIAHVDAQIDVGPLTAFFAAYQETAPLRLGELWAIPIMLRLGLIENLQRITTRLDFARTDRDLADAWVDRLQAMAETNPSRLVIVVADMARSEVPLTSAFVAEFCQRLSVRSPVLHLARSWLEQRLAELGLTIEQLVHQESQIQAADQVSVSHSIAGLRLIGALDWREFVETLSVVEQVLRTDPPGVYAAMDFSTRDRYRHVIESLSRGSPHSEIEVARQAIAFAAASADAHGTNDRTAHVGFYLIDAGLVELEHAARFHRGWSSALEHGFRRFPLAFHLGGIVLLSFVAAAAAGHALGLASAHPAIQLGLGLLLFVGATQPAVALINGLATWLVRPHLLPRLDYAQGIPPGQRTLVVIPTLLARLEDVDRLVETLEIHALANRDPQLRFALLTDFCDAPTPTTPGDDALLTCARISVERLNSRSAPDTLPPFFLLHRPREWNPQEGVWMGRERKRGKLTALNALIRDGVTAPFSLLVGATALLPTIRYVITLDTDTQLPRDAARRLVGAMAHPLNRPIFDPVRGVVTAGYGILQPRVGVSLPGARRSWFARLYAGEAGIDPYTRAVSDVYQDLFAEGSFTGKGIYDVETFDRALAGRIPDNTVLSHDLLEACHARSGLVSDVEFYEDYPSRHNVDAGRRHRWIRGDWQLLPWLRRRVPGPGGTRIANPLSLLSQWKLVDNLRRSLVPPALVLTLAATAWLRPGATGAAFVVVGTFIALPGLVAALRAALHKSADLPLRLHLRGAAHTAGRNSIQIALALAWLPADAAANLDAIARTLVRLRFTRRRLLEWQTSSEVERTTHANLPGSYRAMAAAPFCALAAGSWIASQAPGLLGPILPVLAAWLAAPALAWYVSLTLAPPPTGLSSSQRAFLGRSARRTWHFFETFVTAQENWLPPDNFQEMPAPVIATRTSPTNIGLALLANLAARDFGYLTTGELLQRTRATHGTLRKLERHRGHFYNWYDTRTLQPLVPLYVSFVDSGNLAGHLLTLASGLRELIDAPIRNAALRAGLQDTCGILLALTGSAPEVTLLVTELEAGGPEAPLSLGQLHALARRADRLLVDLPAGPSESRFWARSLQLSIEAHASELLAFAPWLATGDLNPEGATLRGLARMEGPANPRVPGLLAARDLAVARLLQIEALADECEAFAAMDFGFLYDPSRDLFSIGYNVTDRRRDAGFFDLLASEARLGSYVAIAQGVVPQDHWFSLGRLLVATPGEPLLVSWSGSMFEYLMPLLVMPSYEDTLLAHTCEAAVRHQIAYGAARGTPWGISESGYNRTDAQANYQYRAFGVPGLGLKRGLSDDLVIAPYASVMALLVAPREACENLQRMAAAGFAGVYGFYEAADYTPARLPPDATHVLVRSFMAHHQGMSFLALLHLLRGEPMQRRFLACPLLKAADLLLQERIPRTAASVFSGDLELNEASPHLGEPRDFMRTFTHPTPPSPEVHLLSNGRYHVAVSSAGGGYSRWHNLNVTRWREDATRDHWGTFVYLRDVPTGRFWSAAHQPVRQSTTRYEAIFTQGRAEFRQHQGELEIHTEICVSPEDDVELRRLTLINHASVVRIIELTSYAEVVLAPAAADAAHPAFSNLFVQSEFVAQPAVLLCTRRPRSEDERPPWLLHLLVGEGGGQGEISCESDRSRFVGRGGTTAAPAALQTPGPLANTTGSVLDPVIALRRTVTLQPGESAVADFVIGVASTREQAIVLAEKYHHVRMGDRAFELAWTHSQVTLRQLNATEAEAQLFGRLAGSLLYADSRRRAAPSVLRANRRGQSGLWSYGLSGDAPIVLVHISDPRKIELIRQLIAAHSFWRVKGLAVELVIIIEDTSIYLQSLQEEIIRLIASGIEAQMLDKPGGIFVRRHEQIAPEDRGLLQSVARVVLSDDDGSLAEQLQRPGRPEIPVPLLVPTRSALPDHAPAPSPRDLLFANGLGGFTPDGREYVITLAPGRSTPAPWINVIANPHFGTVVSESGSGYTWVENAHEFRLTPWNNDAVQDPPGEALYLRDEHTGQVWSPTPGPARGPAPYVIRHGFGYTVFEHTEHGIRSELTVYVAIDAPVKFMALKIRNDSGQPRRLSATGYWEWVLGDVRSRSVLHVQTELDLKSGALLVRNPYNTDFPDRIAFVDLNDAIDLTRSVTGDRREFIGRNGNLERPAALRRTRLSGRVGAGLDPCGALQVAFDLAEGQEREICFRLGVGRGLADTQTLIQRFRGVDASRLALEGVWAHWNQTLGAVKVETPDPAVNLLANGWLVYQTISCRLWARTGFYQSGGAFGFRDQLQDAMALVHTRPALLREHLLLAASRQFREGDVQHWWHPPGGQGVRTHFSDDFLWLPYATCRYVTTTGDFGVLDERVSFLDSRPLKLEEEAYYDRPNRSEESASLYVHCVRALERGFAVGAHELPLIGCGDWNDGMNKVGHEGRGESVWLAFFLHDGLTQFAQVADRHDDPAFAEHCREHAGRLQEAIEREAWDGAWYRRAYFDDGTPLGSHLNAECQIDSLPQSWAVISGAGDTDRARQAMASVETHLVRREAGLIQLFDPPFDQSPLNPGYIKGYIPGVRENGGQYTHGALWTTMAFALLGEHDRAWGLFNLLNPINHGATAERIALYKVEPYVVAADVYAVAPHTGRGGWTWYTGSAGWMYRLLIETLLGVTLEGDQLRLTPRLPAAWPGFRLDYRFRQTGYAIHVRRRPTDTDSRAHILFLDGNELPGPTVPLTDDRRPHSVELQLR